MIKIFVNRKSLTVVVLTVVALWVASWFMDSLDPVLDGARGFVITSPEVQSRVGLDAKITVLRSRYFEGVPGREQPYRDYVLVLLGDKGLFQARVRATKASESESWAYELRALK
jgi:hypothetical protein